MVVKSIKLPEAVVRRVARQARASGRTASAVIRDALERGLDHDRGIDMGGALKDFIGSVSGGPPDLSTNKEHLRDLGRPRPR